MVAIFDFRYALAQWEAIGIFDVMLPFILVFAIIFAILQKTKIFQARKGIDAIIAMSIAFLAIINPFVSEILKIILSNTVIAVILMVALMLLMGLLLGATRPAAWTFIGGIIGLIFFVWLVGRVADYYEMYNPGTVIFSTMWWEMNLPWILPVLIIVIFAVIVISSGSEPQEKTPFDKIWKSLMKKEVW